MFRLFGFLELVLLWARVYIVFVLSLFRMLRCFFSFINNEMFVLYNEENIFKGLVSVFKLDKILFL